MKASTICTYTYDPVQKIFLSTGYKNMVRLVLFVNILPYTASCTEIRFTQTIAKNDLFLYMIF